MARGPQFPVFVAVAGFKLLCQGATVLFYADRYVVAGARNRPRRAIAADAGLGWSRCGPRAPQLRMSLRRNHQSPISAKSST